ncbi:MAG: NAD(P)H-binding protein [Candidatus Aminicenantes bacterium]|nr:NAD(P)H-binding protein [Candidatus Aminicenantes bacterium]NIM78186.1 NAD(P)H-binding protein [Candidatus Aminicenantes bacterium]NIN17523.1 NAD(P)H-binding protein [Candidatus Aminicenantes bacterium]NIN41409.1 NAD(P)H-binding protein [Candidatus Aminicenantes bacterium]NIN84175.1 NAD(P)H-binding protein [Candidatus Aminicenantes bacterium]
MNSRYSRQVVLEQIGPQGQEVLLRSKVIIIGCGALGTNIANNLARAGVGTLLIVDRDFVELNNLQRQTLFDEEDVGTPKVSAAVRKLRKINSGIEIKYLIKDLNNTNVEGIIDGFDLVVDATDNIPTRMIINDACVKKGMIWIYAGVIQTMGMVMNILPEGPCLRCLLPEIPTAGSLPTCETVGVLNTIPAIVAAIESTEALKILLKKDIEKKLIIYDVWEHAFRTVEIKKSNKCECCIKKDFKFLNQENREIITVLCDNGVQIIPPRDMVLNLEKISGTLEKIVDHLMDSEFLLKFEAEGKKITLFKDGRAIIKGTGDVGAAKSFYTRYLGL